MVTSNDIKNGKPHPEPYLRGASVLGFSAADCVVVEDVPAGIRAGKAAGARVIAFRTTVKDPELRAAGADWVLTNCGDISVAKERSGAYPGPPIHHNHVAAHVPVCPVERSSTIFCGVKNSGASLPGQ